MKISLSWVNVNKFSAHIHQPQIDESTLLAMQQHMAQQAAFSQIPDDVKGVRLNIFSCLSVQ